MKVKLNRPTRCVRVELTLDEVNSILAERQCCWWIVAGATARQPGFPPTTATLINKLQEMIRPRSSSEP